MVIAGILESSMATLQEGQSLLDRIREMGMHADVQNRHATTAACYGIEHVLELLQDRRRHLEELWLQRRIKLEQCLQLLLLDNEVNKVTDWFAQTGDAYLVQTGLGDDLMAALSLQTDHQRFEMQARVSLLVLSCCLYIICLPLTSLSVCTGNPGDGAAPGENC